MGWNGSGQGGSTPQKPKATAKKPSPVRGILAGAIVVALGFGAYFTFFSGAEKPQKVEAEKKTSRIKESKAAPAPVSAAQPLKKHQGKKWRPDVKADRTKDVEPPMLSQREIELKELNRKFFGEPLFKHDSENMISGVLSAVPGDRFLINEVDEGFDRDFAKAVEEKIEVFPDDPDDVKAQKEAVIAAKDMLAKTLAKGESPGSVISDMLKDLNAVADYRDKLEDNVRLVLKEGTEEDVRLYVEECNKMLAEYSARPIEISNRQYERLRKRIAERNANTENKEMTNE